MKRRIVIEEYNDFNDMTKFNITITTRYDPVIKEGKHYRMQNTTDGTISLICNNIRLVGFDEKNEMIFNYEATNENGGVIISAPNMESIKL